MKLQNVTSASECPVHGKWYGDACGTAFALEVLGERWAMLVVRELMLGPRRFSDLRASLPGISARVLTERLVGLEANGVLTRATLPPPAGVQVYELTEWGYRAEPLLQELGRWAASSPLHDPTLPMSAVSMMLSLRTMFDPLKATGMTALIGFDIAGDTYLARLENGQLPIVRGRVDSAAFVLKVDEAATLVGLIYGKIDPAELELAGALSIAGDRAQALAFVDLFDLPQRQAR